MTDTKPKKKGQKRPSKFREPPKNKLQAWTLPSVRKPQYLAEGCIFPDCFKCPLPDCWSH